jgi:hypothetical protein
MRRISLGPLRKPFLNERQQPRPALGRSAARARFTKKRSARSSTPRRPPHALKEDRSEAHATASARFGPCAGDHRVIV